MPKLPRRLRCEPLEDRLTPAAGALDPTFGTNGTFTFPANFVPAGEAVLPDGRVVVAGTDTRSGVSALAVYRFTADGAPDQTFGTAGEAIVSDPGARDQTTGVAVAANGTVALVGTTTPTGGSTASLVVRLSIDGTPNAAFGIGGKVVIPAGSTAYGGTTVGALRAVAVQADGKVVLAGSATGVAQTLLGTASLVVRLNANGTADTTFGSGGSTAVPFGLVAEDSDSAAAVLVQPNGDVVIAGAALVGRVGDYESDFDYAAARLLPGGQLDPSFGSGGIVQFPVGAVNTTGTAITLRPDGKYDAAVLTTTADPTTAIRNVSQLALVQLTAAGSLDGTFGSGGVVQTGLTGTVPPAVTVQGDGKVVAAQADGTKLTVARYNADGTADPTFGTGGRTAVPYTPTVPVPVPLSGGQPGDVAAVVLQRFGRVIAAVGNTAVGLQGDPVAPGTVLVGGPATGIASVYSPSSTGAYSLVTPLQFFPGFAGSVRTATADVTGDGVPDYIGGAGPGGGPAVAVYDGKSGALLASFFAFESTFTGGVFVSAGDLDGDGKADIVVTPDQGGGPVVAVYSGAKLTAGATADAAQITRFLGIADPNFRGGARTTVGDLNGDGSQDLVVAAGSGGGPRVAIYDGRSVATGAASPTELRPDFFAYDSSLRNGVYVAAGDLNGDGVADLAIGAGPGGGPRVRVERGDVLLKATDLSSLDTPNDAIPPASQFPGVSSYERAVQTQELIPTAASTGAEFADFFAGDSSLQGGARVAVRGGQLFVGTGQGEASRVNVYSSATLATSTPTSTPFDPYSGETLADGVFVG